jgi:hypothetical protein
MRHLERPDVSSGDPQPNAAEFFSAIICVSLHARGDSGIIDHSS